MKAGLRKLYTGDYNYMSHDVQADGTAIVTLSKEGEGKVYEFRVRGLYGEDEEVLEHKVINTKPKRFLLDRMKEAKQDVATGSPLKK